MKVSRLNSIEQYVISVSYTHLVGILSVCGQTAADNTISLTPVEETTADQSGRLIEYNFSGHRSEAEGVLFGCYISVSYTHLDVYKRQGQHRSFNHAVLPRTRKAERIMITTASEHQVDRCV